MALSRTISSTARSLPDLWGQRRWLSLDWAYALNDKRDLRLDLLRGFAVFAMIADHLGGASWLYLVTGGNAFFTSGAEAFVFISGFVVGVVYGGIALKEGLQAAQVKVLRRAWTLYGLTVVLTLAFAAVSLFFNLPWAQGLTIGDLLTFAFNVATLQQTMYLVDILLTYTFLMLAAPIGLGLLVKGRTRWLVAGSSALWLASQLFPTQIQVPWQITGGGAFQLSAWQLLFFVAMAMGFHRDALTKKLNSIPRVPYLILSGLLLLWLVQFRRGDDSLLTGISSSGFFLKSILAPGRLIASFILFQFTYLLATLLWKPIQATVGWLLRPLGQNALYGYTMHIAVIALFNIALARLPEGVPTSATDFTALQLLAVLAIRAMIRRRFLFKIVPR